MLEAARASSTITAPILPPSHVDIRPEDLIVYELHVQDYTARLPGLPPALRGTYLGLAQGGLKTPGGLTAGIDHLAELGVTAVELMPVMQYDKETTTAAGRVNHWGYMTTNFFAPETRYASRPGEEVIELKRLVQAFHDRGIAVFMDVVYNHTAEGSWVQDGRLADKCYDLCDDIPEIYRGTGNGFFTNTSGTGNDVDFSGGDRFTKHLVLDSLAAVAHRLWRGRVSLRPRPHIGRRFDRCRRLGQCRSPLRSRAPPRRAVGHGGSGGTSWTARPGTGRTIAGPSGSASTATERDCSPKAICVTPAR